MATRRERERAFARARDEALRQRSRLMRDARAEIVRLLQQAQTQIAAAIAQAGDDATVWRLEGLQREVRQALEAFTRDAGPAGARALDAAWRAGERLIDAPLAAAGIELQGLARAIDVHQLEAMRTFMTDKIRDLGARAVDRVNTQLGLTILGAQSPFEAVRAVQRILGDETRARATVIVRTELNRAFSAASQARLEAAHAAGLAMRKQWRRSGKVHSRPEHDAADGQIREASELFVIHTKTGPVALMHPGDPKAPPGQTVNCGCTMLPVLPAMYDGLIEYRTPGRRPFSEDELRRNQAKLDFDERVKIRP